MKINRKQKELIKMYGFILVAVVIMMNWNSISWMFNYRELYGLWYGFMYPYEDNNNVFVSASNSVVASQNTANAQVQERQYPYTAKQNSIEIAQIDIAAPIVIGRNTDVSVLEEDLNKGVVYYPGSASPGKPGQSVLLGHSAPVGWPKIRYDWVFTKINDLENGDEIIIHFNNRQYTYKVISKEIIDKGEELDATSLHGSDNILTLVTCWPPGKNYKRVAVYAKLQ